MATLGQAALAAERGDFATARELYLRGLEVARALNAAEPRNVKRQRDVMVTLNRLGDLAVSTSDLVGARDWYGQGLEIAQLLTRQDAGNRLWEQDLLFSYEKLGDVELAVGERGAATRRYEQARQGYERMIARYGTQPMVLAALAAVYGKLGNVAIDAEDVRAARYWIDRGRYEKEYAIEAALVEQNRAPWNLYWLLITHLKLATVSQAQGLSGEVAEHLDRAEALYEELRRDGAFASHAELRRVEAAIAELRR